MNARVALAVSVVLAGSSAQAGVWKLKGGAVFTGTETWASGDWSRKLENRTETSVLATNKTKDGKSSLTVKAEWAAPQATLKPGEVVAMSMTGTVVQYLNPLNLGGAVTLVAFQKSPYEPFFEGNVAMKTGGELKLKNENGKAPNGGKTWTLVYRVLGLGSALDFEYTYEWVDDAAKK